MDFDYCEENLRTISNKIFIYSVKKSNISFKLDFFRAALCSWGFKKKECYVVDIIELFLYQKHNKADPS